MGRPSKLSPAQWAEVDRRLAEGEGPSKLAREYGISPAQISRRGVSHKPQNLRNVAQKVAEAQTALSELPVNQQYTALKMAEKLMSISDNYASAAELSTRTGLRMFALANAEAQKVDDADPLSDQSMTALKGIGVLTKLGNDALVPASNLLAANKERMMPAAPPSDDGAPSGVLVVPGVLQDAKAWTQLVQGSKT